MQEFSYTITDPLGIHARPAGQFAKLAKSFEDTEVTVTKKDKTVKASQLMKLMSLAAKKGDEIVVAASGAKEVEAASALKDFLEKNL